MTDQRKALHAQVEQTREEEIDRLTDLIDRFLHPVKSTESERIVFEPIPPGFKQAAELQEQRQHGLARLKAKQSETIRHLLGDIAPRLGIDLNKFGESPRSWSAYGSKSEDFTCNWFEGQVSNRLGIFYLKEQKVVTFEKCYLSKTQPELIYKVRVLTPVADLEKEVTVFI